MLKKSTWRILNIFSTNIADTGHLLDNLTLNGRPDSMDAPRPAHSAGFFNTICLKLPLAYRKAA